MKTIWNDNHISLSSKIRLMRSLVISVLLYACEIWTSTADILKKFLSEMRCFRKLLGISYRDHITKDAVRNGIRQAVGPYDNMLTTVKKHKLKWFGHVSRSAGLAKTILQGTVHGGRRRGRKKVRADASLSLPGKPESILVEEGRLRTGVAIVLEKTSLLASGLENLKKDREIERTDIWAGTAGTS
ncbi:unnamed protein product [Porites evermanni]|uniref:Endonuclease-reverse transcriptase n=1 Tax=Porites evermanni TaxID=104178 RepID=A0ABN8RGK1_9CNID|nr:unnamed protein product [Porites evermanni]